MKRDSKLFIEDILESIDAIEEFSFNLDEKELNSNRLKQSAIIRELEIIGEAVKNLPEFLKKSHPNIPWKQISGFRDVLSHAYFGINMGGVWNIIKNDLPKLKKEIKEINEDLIK